MPDHLVTNKQIIEKDKLNKRPDVYLNFVRTQIVPSRSISSGVKMTTTQDPTTVLPHILKNVAQMSFSWYDYILFCVMLGLSALIGIYFGCFGTKQSSAGEYLMGSKKMKVFPISVSLVASHISGITLLAVPADIYRFGAAYWLCLPALVVVTLSTVYIYLPVFYNLQITSTYEYLERRFDSTNRLFASFLFALGLVAYLPIVIYIPALALSAATGINIHYITPVVCGVCIFYTTLGGLKAVVWTDTLQFIVTTGAVFTVVVLGVKAAGGFGPIWSTALEGNRLDIFDFDPDPTKRDSFWIVFIGITVGWLSMCAIHQSCVQKYLSLPTLREAKLSVILFAIGLAVVVSCSVFIGLIMYARYSKCDPFTSGAVQKNDQLLPYYIMDVASHIPGLSGLFIAGIFCAALSTLSASLNCLAGTLFEDFILKWTGPIHNEKTTAYILKLIVVVTGVICTVLVFIVERLGGILPLAFSLGSVTAAPLLGMFTLGVLCPKASSKGTFYGSVIGLVISGWIIFMAQYYKAQGVMVDVPKPISIEDCLVTANITTPSMVNLTSTTTESLEPEEPFFLYRISFYYYIPLGTVITMFSALILSLILTNDDPPVHKDLLSPVIHGMLSDQKLVDEKSKDYYRLGKALNLVTINSSEENTEPIKV